MYDGLGVTPVSENSSPEASPAVATVSCPKCRGDVALGETFCPSCGADLALVGARGRARLSVPWTMLALVGVVAAATTVGWRRFQAVGPGPDLATTVHWIAQGDDERQATLATLMRAYETARAVMRSCIDNGEPCAFSESGWPAIARYSNAVWRGFVPLVQWAVSADSLGGRLGELLAVDGRDGWDRPWKAAIVPMSEREKPEGFHPGALRSGSPPPAGRALWRLELVSSGPDGAAGTADDITFEAVFPAPGPLRIGDVKAMRDREAEVERGLVWVRWSGTELDLVDGRMLAEFLLESKTGE